MPSVFVHRRIHIPMIGTWKWTMSDYSVPLVFQLHGVKARLRLEHHDHEKGDRRIAFQADLELEFTNPTPQFLRGLRTSGKLAQAAAEVIYGHHQTVIEQFEGVLRTAGGVRNLTPGMPTSMSEFFSKSELPSWGCRWHLEGEKPRPFTPAVSTGPRKLNPLFRGDQILTPSKWKRLQVAVDNQDFPTAEMMELLRIRAQLQWRDNKIPTIEAAILVETILREYAEKALLNCGFSKNRIKALREELTFNTFLNIVLPLSLTKREASVLEQHIRKVDLLRRVRNDIVHGNIKVGDIDESNVRDGIEGALAVVAFIRRKLSDA